MIRLVQTRGAWGAAEYQPGVHEAGDLAAHQWRALRGGPAGHGQRAQGDSLGTKAIFLGERPTTVDATVYAYVASIIGMGLPSPVKDFGRSRENLVHYCQRVHERFFPELAAATWR